MVSVALMAVRIGLFLAMPVAALALSLGGISAQAQPGAADAAPYPVEADTPAGKPAAKSARKPVVRAPARPPVAAVALPPVKPDAIGAVAAPAPEKAQTKVEEKVDSSGDVFAGIPQDERLKVQAALLWSGDYTGAANGDDPMLTATKNFQKRKKYKVTGALSASERAELVAAAHDREQEFGWSVVADPATGIRIGLPTKMVPHAREAQRGTRWSSRYGDVQVETFRHSEPNLKLSALFEREKNSPGTRKVEYSVLRDDNFFVSGLQGLRRFSVRAQMRNGEVRGFTVLFDQAMEGIVAPVVVAMASAFSPFPQRSAPFAALAKSVEYGNGLIVSAQGHIVTDARLTSGCRVIVVPELGDAERVAEDADSGIALLRVYGPRKLTPLSLALAAPATRKATDLTLAGLPDPKEHDGSDRLSEVKARLIDGNAIELRQPVPMAGLTGAAALDGQGRFVGMTEMRNAVVASLQPAAPPLRLVRADTIGNFLETHQVAMAPPRGGDPRDSIARIICVRK